MRKQLQSKRATLQQKRLDRLWADANKFEPRRRNAGDGLIHIEVGRYVDIWVKAPRN
jgi:hypothetical protein